MKTVLLRLSSEATALLRRAARLSPETAYLVGGAIRDAALGRPTADLDIVSASPRTFARGLAQALDAGLVLLDDDNAVFRLILGPSFKDVRQIDVAGLKGRNVVEDLARRDFTADAIALPLSPELPERPSAGRCLDPRGGLLDISKRILRAESEVLLRDDPLRILRAFRIAAQLDFTIEAATLKMLSRLRQLVTRPAAERIQSELMALLSVPGSSRWLRLMDETRVLTALFKELEAGRQCAFVYYGPGGVLSHSLETVSRADFLLHNLNRVFPGEGRQIEAQWEARPQGGAPQRAVLMLAALLHDIAKPETARRVQGRLRFFGHDALGAKRAAAVLKRLKFSREHTETISAVIAHHLRPGNLAAGEAVTDKAVYRFFRDLGEHAVSLLLVCWADHASYLPEALCLKSLKAAGADPGDWDPARKSLSRLPKEARKTVHHLQVISYLLKRRFDVENKPIPDKLIDGHDVMKSLGLPPGPRIGELLEKVREAQAEGKIRSRQEALRLLKMQ